MFEKLALSNIVWFPEKGYGYYHVQGAEYDEKYFNKYEVYAQTEIGKSITRKRVELVDKYCKDYPVLDVGIGCGDFIKKHGYSYGYDINLYAVNWLINNGLYVNLYNGMHYAATFWDSLEHIEKPDIAVSHVKKYVFVSMPIYKDEKEVLKSKHFRKNEHYWYFTKEGLINWFFEQGFEIVDHNEMETELGREGIGTFVFRRMNA